MTPGGIREVHSEPSGAAIKGHLEMKWETELMVLSEGNAVLILFCWRYGSLIGYQYGGFSKRQNLPYHIVHVHLAKELNIFIKEVLALQC